MMGVMCYVCDVWISDWRYWAMVALVIIPYYCGKYDGENNKGDK